MQLRLITSNQELLDLLPRLMRGPVLAIDTETTGLDWTKDVVVGVSFSLDGETGWYVPFAHTSGPQCSYLAVRFVMESLLLNPELIRVFHNSKFDIHQCWTTFGVRTIHPYHDTLIMAFLEDNTIPKGLKDWSFRLWGPELKNLEAQLKRTMKANRAPSFGHLTPEQVGDYAAGDAVFTFKLFDHFKSRALNNSLYWTELELVDLVIDMERKGIRIDADYLERAGVELAAQIPVVEAELVELAGWDINPRSPQQVAKLLYDQLGLPVLAYTDTGNPSTAEEVLLNLPPNPIIDFVLRARALSKLKSTYVDGILSKLDPHSRLHCRFNQMGAETGRFSSSKPNLQNIPREGSMPISIRQAFIPSAGKIFVFADYRQVEMRLFAHYSNDAGLLKAAQEGFDFHRFTASWVFHKTQEEITKAERKFAKSINFGICYGLGVGKLAMRLGITKREARSFLKRYHRTFPGVNIFTERCKDDFNRLGYVENLFGRRRKIPFDKAYRSVNTLIQSSAADVLKDAMVRLKPLLKISETGSVMTIHDEIVFEVPREEINIVSRIIDVMEKFRLRVPINIDVEWSDQSWGHKKPLEMLK
jgi:DNA polymerase-1